MTFANKIIFFLICTCMVLTTMLYGTVHQPTIALFYIFVSLMLVLWAYDSFAEGRLQISRHVLQIPIFAAAIYAFVQIIPFGKLTKSGIDGIPRTISASPFETQLTGLHYLSLAIFFSVSVTYINSASRISKLVNLIAIFGFAYAFFAILQSFLSPGKIYGIYERFGASPFGSFVSRHNFAAFMEMTLAIPLGLLFVGAVKRDKKLLYITAITLMGVALLLSGSRGGFVSLLAELVLLIFLTTRSKGAKSIALKVALASILVGAVIAGAIFVGGESSLTRIAETANSKDVTANRTHIWGITLKVIAHNLPFGGGLGAFGQAYTQFDDFSGLERVEQAHNDYLQVLADAGLVGAVIGGFFLFWLFKTGRRSISTNNLFRRGVAAGSLAGIFAILVHSVFDFVLHTTAVSIMFLLLLTLLVASGREYDDDEKEELPERRRRSAASITPISSRR